MHSVQPAMKPIKGMVDVSIRNNQENAVELAAAWGLFSGRKGKEKWLAVNGFVVFRMKQDTYEEWLDIVTTVKQDNCDDTALSKKVAEFEELTVDKN